MRLLTGPRWAMQLLGLGHWSSRAVWVLIGAGIGGLVLPRCEPLLPHPDCPPDDTPTHRPHALIGAAFPSRSTTDPERP